MNLGPAALALVIATSVTAFELITSRYPRTLAFVVRCWTLWAYALLYGLLSGGAMLGLDALVAASQLKLEGIGLDNPWVQAIVLGLAVKALLHIRIATVSGVPIGTETIVQLFEPWLLRETEICEFNRIRNFIQPIAAKYPTLAAVQARILANLPGYFTGPELAAFQVSLGKKTTVDEAMELYLITFGRDSLRRVFP